MRRYYFFILGFTALVLGCQPIAQVGQQSQPVAEAQVASVQPQSSWARARVDAVAGIWNITPEGRAWMESYDLRQMPGQPGWFGSHGNGSWAGAGQARPSSVLHELMHSYWGAFDVTGLPGLSWQTGLTDSVAPAMQMYRRDLITFMQQPPDQYEPLRERLRNFPNLSRGDYPDLYHFGEADLAQGVGGNLNLVPPILRKYYDRFLEPGPFANWREAIAWYLGVPPEQRGYADLYIGMNNIPLRPYEGLRPASPTSVSPDIPAIARGEERQRLTDFANQYALIKVNQFSLVDAAQADRGFYFWRWYLSEARELYRQYPEILHEQTGGTGQRLADMFDVYIQAEEMPLEKRVAFLKERFAQDSDLLDFSALLPGQTLVQLFADTPLPTDPNSAKAVTRLYTDKLVRYTQATDSILTTARKDPQAGARALEALFAGISDDVLSADMGMVYDLLRDANVELTRTITNGLSDGMIVRMVQRNSGVARNDNVRAERLLAALGVRSSAQAKDLVNSIRTVVGVTSGNFEIDAPTTNLLYKVLAEVGASRPADALTILEQGGLPLLPFVQKHPDVAQRVFAAAPERFATLVASAGTNDYGTTPWRIIHGTIVADPDLAAALVGQLDKQGKADIVSEATIVFAFDAERTADIPGIKLSVANDARFLDSLARSKGQTWLAQAMGRAVTKYARQVRDGEIDPTFMVEYRRTLQSILSKAPTESRTSLESAFQAAFAQGKQSW